MLKVKKLKSDKQQRLTRHKPNKSSKLFETRLRHWGVITMPVVRRPKK